jgi:hypothetical protein
MRNDLTDVVVVLDRSGSMGACKEMAESGLNHFISRQKELPGESLFTLVQFNHTYEFVHQGTPMQHVGEFHMVTEGTTALLDAVGRAIVETGQRLAAMDEADRPGLVAFVIITDGQENMSREYSKQQIKEMIEHQHGVYNWQFTFLGANQDAFAEAGAIGIAQQGTANFGVRQAYHAFDAAAANVGRMRRDAAVFGAFGDACFTEEEREAMHGTTSGQS